jgi:endonuclease G
MKKKSASAKRKPKSTAAKKRIVKSSTLRNPSREKVQSFLRNEALSYLDDPNINSVGLGYKLKNGKPTKELAIQFTVDEKVPENTDALEALETEVIPKSFVIDGIEIKTDVIERKFEPKFIQIKETEKDTRKQRLSVVRPGISVSHINGTAGTLGCIVYDNDTYEPLILSNWHVLHGPEGKIGDLIAQPGPYDDNSGVQKNKIGRLLRSHLGVAGDCAVCSIEGRNSNPLIYELDLEPTGIGKTELGDKVIKSGRTTAVTYGIVRRIDVTTKINYGGSVGSCKIGGFEIGPDPSKPAEEDEISKGGDSGSVWMFRNGGKTTSIIAGLHFAGESGNSPDEHAIACNIHSVFSKLNIGLKKGSSNGTSSNGEKKVIKINDLRSGYNSGFLSKPVALPKLSNGLSNKVAKTYEGKSVLDYVHYSLVMNKERRMTFYTACNIDGTSLKKIPRGDKWMLDDRLDPKYQLGNDAYKDNKLDRGHMVRRLDTVWGNTQEAKYANDDTFYYTNSCPQHAKLNQRTWNDLEDYILDNAGVHDLRVSVFTGPVFQNDDIDYRDFKIPQEFWKVVVIVKEETDELSATAYIQSQTDYMDELEAFSYGEFRTYQVPIKKIEQKTSIKFGNLSDFDPIETQPQTLGSKPFILIDSLENIVI